MVVTITTCGDCGDVCIRGLCMSCLKRWWEKRQWERDMPLGGGGVLQGYYMARRERAKERAMAVWKNNYNEWNVDVGDLDGDKALADQLRVTPAELCQAINAEGVGDRLFRRVMLNRSKAHARLLEAVPGAKGEGA